MPCLRTFLFTRGSTLAPLERTDESIWRDQAPDLAGTAAQDKTWDFNWEGLTTTECQYLHTLYRTPEFAGVRKCESGELYCFGLCRNGSFFTQ
ncbi:hypothetical protein BV898_15941 [Hypsibius exemplaris]|uniref:Uncharacterized protein n=1 Tax=Hypsibius exemplaris TaxID=2072580 RepID=A0A9X6NCK4_HYPEX|nr:hypothetical protein BV898_15941 [Hypsibius exemplaris]